MNNSRVVPLALALLNISHPDFAVIDQLSRLTHDSDADVAQSAIMVRPTLSRNVPSSPFFKSSLVLMSRDGCFAGGFQ